MKINIGKLANIFVQVLVAAPQVITTVKPVVDAAKEPKPSG